MNKLCVLGSGSWGSALALALAKNNENIIIWSRREEVANEINLERTNSKYLPGIKFSKHVKASSNLEDCLKDAKIIVLAVPSQQIRNLAKKIAPFLNGSEILVNVAKGIEKGSSKRLSEVCKEELPNNTYTILSGPSHAEEVARDIPTAIVVSSENMQAAEVVQDHFMNSALRVYLNSDLVGVELGGALKNIIAFGAGVLDGMGYGDNSKAALMTRGLSEIGKLGIELGAKISTFGGLTGIGDLIVTCTSKHSRNRKAGVLIGEGYTLDEALEKVMMVVEGVTATEAFYKLSKEIGVEMPITEAIYKVIREGASPEEVILNLMTRAKKHEVEDLDLY